MKILLVAGIAFSLALPAVAGPLRDVPPGFWAAGSVHRVVAHGLMTPMSNGKFEGNRSVTRYELAVILDRLVRDMEAAHRPLSALPPSRVTVPKGTPAAPAAALKHLVGNGFLTPDTPLLTRPGAQDVTATEMADALSQVTLRLSDRSLPPQKN
jgi:hypothetical protein